MTRVRFALILGFLGLLTLLSRTVGPWRVIFPEPGKVHFLDIDSYFHTRHSLYTLRHFPQLLRQDMAVEFPHGARSDAAGLFDLGIAFATKVVAGSNPTELELLRVAAWTPAVLGALSVVLLGILAARFLASELALWVVLALSVHPGTFLTRTTLGFADHHAAEVFLSLAVVLGFTKTLAGGGAGMSILGAFPQLVFLFLWAGAPLYIPILAVALVTVVAIEVHQEADPERTIQGALRYGLVMLITSGLIARVFPDAVMHPLALMMAGLASLFLALAPWVLHALARWLRRRGHSPGQAALRVTLAAIGAALVPILCTAKGRSMVSYLLTAKTPLIVEQQPVSPGLYCAHLGLPGLLAALALPLTCYQAARGGDRLAIVPAAVGTIVTVLWIRTSDYGYQVPAFSALLAGFVLSMVPGIATGCGRLFQVLLLLPPLLFTAFPRPYATAELALSMREVTPAWDEAMAWMREATPLGGVPPQPLEPAPTGEKYGVTCAWDRGNFVSSLGNRWPVYSRYPTPESVRWLITTSVADFLDGLTAKKARGKVRYVIIDSASVSDKFMSWVQASAVPLDAYRSTADTLRLGERNLFPANYGKLYLEAISTRLYYTNGAGLGHLRLVFASVALSRHFFLIAQDEARRHSLPVEEAEASQPPIRPGGTIIAPNGVVHDVSEEPSVKIFEVVSGAVLTGKAAPGSPVNVELNLTLASGQKSKWVAGETAGPDGRFRIRVPFACGPVPGANVQPSARYRVIASRPDNARIITIRGISVSEAQVQSGTEVQLP